MGFFFKHLFISSLDLICKKLSRFISNTFTIVNSPAIFKNKGYCSYEVIVYFTLVKVDYVTPSSHCQVQLCLITRKIHWVFNLLD